MEIQRNQGNNGNKYVINAKIKNKNAGAGTKFFAVMLSTFIIGILLFSAPARAFVLDLSSDKTSVSKGELIVFTASVDINSNERLPIDKVVLELLEVNGVKNVSCEFSVDGTAISGCDGLTIKKLNDAFHIFSPGYGYGYNYGYYNNNGQGYGYNFGDDSGYGYGYSNGKLSYEIRLNTDNYLIGEYSTKLKVFIKDKVFSRAGNSITISLTNSGGNGGNGNSGNSESFGGGGLQPCLNAWTCSDWSSCSNGKQTRTCVLKPNCYRDNDPIREKSCISSGLDNSGNNNNNNNNNNSGSFDNLNGDLNNNNNNNNSDDSGFDRGTTSGNSFANRLSGITGAVIGLGSGNNVFVIVLLVLLIGLFATFIAVRKVRKVKRYNALIKVLRD
jgi:uncharacterized membrane protein YgcG